MSNLQDNKENLFLLLNGKNRNRKEKMLYFYLGYGLITRGLWYYGYFPYFFHYTKYISTCLLLIGVYLSNYNLYLECFKYDLLDFQRGYI